MPTNFKMENAHQFTIAAQVIQPTEIDYEEVSKAAKGFIVASNAPYDDSGRPKMLFLNAWMAHEGRNLNGDAFVKEELERRVKEGLFAPPYAGMIDDDHDFTARGFWYKTNFAYDPVAKAWGIFAQGAIWAWRYTELADRLIDEQETTGKIMVSMSTIPESRELSYKFPGYEGQLTKVLHNPVFFTTSTLSVPPGDDHARGVVSDLDPKDYKAIDPSGTNPQLDAGEAHMAKNDKKETAAAGNVDVTAMALNKLIFPKAHWASAQAVLDFANNEALGSWSVTEGDGGFVLLCLDDANFKAGTMRTTCVAGAPETDTGAACAIKAVVGDLNVDGPITVEKVNALKEKAFMTEFSPVQTAFKAYLAKADSTDKDAKTEGPNDVDNKDKNMNKAETMPADKEDETMAGKSKDKDETDGVNTEDASKEKPGDKKDDKEPDNDDDDMKKADENQTKPPVKGPQDQETHLGPSNDNKASDSYVQLESELKVMKSKLAEAEAQIATLTDANAKLTADLTGAMNTIDTYEKKKVDEALDQTLAKRLAGLPDDIKQNLEKHPKKDEVLAQWRKASATEWELISASFGLVSKSLGITERSELAGALPVGGSSATDNVSTSLKSYLRD